MKRLPFLAAALVLVGCGANHRHWEIAVHNTSQQTYGVTIRYGNPNGGGSVSIDGVEAGKTVSLAAGTGTIMVESVQVKVGANEQTAEFNTEISEGKRFTLSIAADGTLKEAVTSR